MIYPKLDARLEALAELVRPGAVVADIGTDHGYLIARLTADGKIPGGYASDINKKPLEKAAFSLHTYGVENRISLVLCDGLSGIKHDCDDIVIAGMGGDMIWKIIEDAPWTHNPQYHFILQPMTKIPDLRRMLYANGFVLEAEKAAVSGGYPYCAMSVRFTGKKQEISAAFAWGGFLQKDISPAARIYMDRVCAILTQKVEGIRKSHIHSKLTEYEELLMLFRDTNL